MIRWAFTGLAALTAALAALFVVELDYGIGRDSGSGAVEDSPRNPTHFSSSPANPPTDNTNEWAGTILARPLFSLSRRPPVVSEVSASETVVAKLRQAAHHGGR